MQRDLELIRKILLSVEDSDEPLSSDDIVIEDFDREHIDYHIQLLVEGEFLAGVSTANFSNTYEWLNLRLTWEGHDFLDSARNDGVWQATTSTIRKQLGSAAVETVKALLIEIAKSSLGLP